MNFDLEIFNLIIDADSWSNKYLDSNNLDSSLRSTLLKPKSELWDYVTPDKHIEETVNKLCEARSHAIRLENIDLVKKPAGRILCFYPDRSYKDAVVCTSSLGFIDREDSPPWDTWLCYVEKNVNRNQDCSSLYSWVPSSIVTTIENAIQEDLYGCLIWAERLEQRLGLYKSK